MNPRLVRRGRGLARDTIVWCVCAALSAGAASARAQDPERTYFEFQVTKPVRHASGSKAPRYPADLKANGVQGEVLAQFIVDTLGVADPKSFKVLRSQHQLFSEAVLAALPDMRFEPAELNGRKVKQLVQQPFVFAIAGKESEMPRPPSSAFPSAAATSNLPLTPAPRSGSVDGWMFEQRMSMDSSTSAQPVTITTRVYASIGKLRMEMVNSRYGDAVTMVTLMDSEAKRLSMVMDPQKMVMVSALGTGSASEMRSEPIALARTVVDLGEGERMAGRATRHYRVTGSAGAKVTLGERTCVIERPTNLELWMTADAEAAGVMMHIRTLAAQLSGVSQLPELPAVQGERLPPGTPVKLVRRETVALAEGAQKVVTITTEFTKFAKGPMDASLFDPPEGYRLLDTSALPSGGRADSLRLSIAERAFNRMTDSTRIAPGEKRTCTTTSKP